MQVSFMRCLSLSLVFFTSSSLQSLPDFRAATAAGFTVFLGSQSFSDPDKVYASGMKMASDIHVYDAAGKDLEILAYTLAVLNRNPEYAYFEIQGNGNRLSDVGSLMLQQLNTGDFVQVSALKVKTADGKTLQPSPVYGTLK